MKYNNKITMKDIFMNEKLKGIFPQFSVKEARKKVLSDAFVRQKVLDYLKETLNGKVENNNLIVPGKFKDKFLEIVSLKNIVEEMFNNYENFSIGIKKDLKLYTPFQSISQIENITTAKQIKEILQIVLDNIAYNPDFQPLGANLTNTATFIKEQQKWLKKVCLSK